MTARFPPLGAGHPALAPLLAAGFAPAQVNAALAFYDEPHRVYHDRVHLHEMLDAVSEFGGPLSAAQALALLFHDAVYVPGAPRGANELLSAQLMRVYAAALPSALVETAHGIVMDTAEHVARSAEAELVLDLDLMRLAAAPAEFDRYSLQIFAEQRPLIAIADDAAALAYFHRQRVPFFEQLLQRTWIFCTPFGRARYEAAARANLQRAIALVTAPDTRETA
ncbi:MAG: DUF1653 domain-containing protein [Burkholderiaceae bacterium]|nr:DUF1653 domain-containing protein [Burkholderiaceae bacterium]